MQKLYNWLKSIFFLVDDFSRGEILANTAPRCCTIFKKPLKKCDLLMLFIENFPFKWSLQKTKKKSVYLFWLCLCEGVLKPIDGIHSYTASLHYTSETSM